ncbi:MAG: tyrosine-type recombinase/integrase [Anaerostipes sp.]|nr:tyrosine-type recombinase/integrase [Anaerostipes sp.]
MCKDYFYSSIFSSYITDYIHQRRLSGFSFTTAPYWLSRFDRYCVLVNVTKPAVTKELFDSWSVKSKTENKTTQSSRIDAVRGFCIYLNAMGIASYIPRNFTKAEKKVPYLMSDNEIHAFFEQVDAYETSSPAVDAFVRLAKEYKILFRLIYCCGLRNSEACGLKYSDTDIDNGILTIRHSKGDKDRLVYLAKDVSELCGRYKDYLIRILGHEPEWLFPGRDTEKPIPNTSVDRIFNKFWNDTDSSKACDKKPTVHCLRHSFVIKRMNLWMASDMDLGVMMPYLSSYLGHAGTEETYYYYHQVEEAFESIKRKDKLSSRVIPEVEYE